MALGTADPDGSVTRPVMVERNSCAGGCYLLQGRQVFYYESGHKQWESTYQAGERTFVETWWSDTGARQWERNYSTDGVWDWKL